LRSGRTADRWLKLICCLCFLLIVVALLLIDRHSPATGYELSIYESLPPLVWISLVAALAGGTGIVVHQAFAGQKCKYWFLGFVILLLVTSIVLMLPVLKGYYFYGSADTMSHVDWSAEVLQVGHFWQGNQYPITHVLIAQLAQTSGASNNAVARSIPALFTLLFMLFSYLLARRVMPQRGPALLAAASTALFFNYYHVSVYPQTLSIMMLPVLYFLYFKSFGRASPYFRIAFVLVLLLFPFFHPAPAAVLVVSLLAAEGAKAAWRARGGVAPASSDNGVEDITFEPSLIASVAFLTWISSHAIFYKTIWNTLWWLKGEIQIMPRVAEVEFILQGAGLSVEDQVVLGLKLYGDSLVYLLLSGIALLIVAWRFLGHRREVRNLSILSMPFLISGPAWVLIFATTMSVTIGRLLGSNVMMWATPVFAAFALYEIFAKWKRARVLAVTAILLLASVIGGAAVYHSPYVLQASWHITEQDIHGVRWVISRAADQVQRLDYANLDVPFMFVGRVRLPDHFGYHEQQTLGRSLGRDALLLLTERSKMTSSDPVLQQLRLSDPKIKLVATDFQRVERDPTVSRLYSSGEFEVLGVVGASGGS
jgi:hypothetical protein